jgi:hypothetical protein
VRTSLSRRLRRWSASAAMAATALAVLAGPAAPAGAVGGPSSPPPASSSPSPAAAAPSADGSVLFGPELDWASDGPGGYQERLGETPSLYAVRIGYPLDDQSRREWTTAASASAEQGAVLVVSLEPRGRLTDLTPEDADDLATFVQEVHDDYATRHLIRFAAEMNGSWTSWGQQPIRFGAAFRTVADAVHAGSDDAEMVWAPSYGAGYPFDRAGGRIADLTSDALEALDTDGDGALTEGDDPYGPYWPGDDAVDRVGLSLYYFGKGAQEAAAGTDVPLTRNSAPVAGELESRLDETWGYLEPQAESFVERFSVERDLPLLLDTGALYDPDLGGDDEEAVKRGWWRQVLTALPQHPTVDAVTWLESEREEAEAGDAVVDWRATADETLAAALRDDLEASGLIRFGPVTDRVTPEDGTVASVQVRQEGGDGAEMGWIVALAAGLAAAFLLAGLAGRLLPSWRYPDDGKPGRDLRIDLFRGFIIVMVVVTHIEVTSPWSFVALKAVGSITGAEMFVVLSGIVLGMVYPLALRRGTEWGAAVASFVRARKQYVVALAVVLLVFVLGFVPFVDTSAITTFTDRGTGGGGESSQGRVYDLYPNADRLLDYPPPWYAVRQFLTLQMGPWPFNIMGLFVVLSLAVPALMWLVKRGFWWVVLLVSWALYGLHYAFPAATSIAPQFDAVFPLFVWQVLFTHGLVLGWYRTTVTKALTGRVGLVLVTVFVVGYAAFLGWLWAGHAFGFTPVPFPAGLYDSLYLGGYQRIDLQWGRLVDVAFVVVVTYALLTAFWKPIAAASAWLWIPLGQASLYVFIVHVFFVLAVANVPGLDRASWWQGTIIHTAVVAVIWCLVRWKVLFKVIPR